MSQVIDFDDSVERKRRKFVKEAVAHNNESVCSQSSGTATRGKVPKKTTSKKRINVNKYAVVNLNADSDVVGLFRVLTAAGFMKVTLLPDLLAHPDVDLPSIADSLRQILISSSSKGPDNANGCQGSDSSGKTDKDFEAHSSTYSSYNILAAINGSVAELKKASALDSDSLLKHVQPPKPKVEIQHSAKCKICHKEVPTIVKFMFSHVHLHSADKQYECALPHCHFEDNNIAEVKQHMAVSHPASLRAPLNKWSAQLHEQWTSLMDICFPNSLGSDVMASRILPTKWSSMRNGRENRSDDQESAGIGCSERLVDVTTKPSDYDAPVYKYDSSIIHSCNVCGEAFVIPDYAGDIPEYNPYTAHLAASHLRECIPYRCNDCGYCHRNEWSVIQHVSSFHPLLSDPSSLVFPAPEPQPRLFVSKFFPFASGFPLDSAQPSLADVFSQPEVQAPQWQPAVKSSNSSETCETMETPVDHNVLSRPSAPDTYTTSLSSRSFSSSEIPYPDRTECLLCGQFFRSTRLSLLEHAKRHGGRRRYRCPHCDYSSHLALSTRAHLMANHPHSCEIPIDTLDDDMRRSWERLLSDCFPSKAHLLTNWRERSNFNTRRAGSFPC